MSFLLALTLPQTKAYSELSLLGQPHVLAESRDRAGLSKASLRLCPLSLGSPIQPQSHSQAPAGLPAAIYAEWA